MIPSIAGPSRVTIPETPQKELPSLEEKVQTLALKETSSSNSPTQSLKKRRITEEKHNTSIEEHLSRMEAAQQQLMSIYNNLFFDFSQPGTPLAFPENRHLLANQKEIEEHTNQLLQDLASLNRTIKEEVLALHRLRS